MSSRYGPGVTGGIGLSATSYKRNSYSTVFPLGSLTPGTSIEFTRVTGPQRISISYTTGGATYTWAFSVTGGTNITSPEVLPMFPNTNPTYNPSINFITNPLDLPALGCTVVVEPIPTNSTRINIFQVAETVTGGAITLQFAMCPFAGIPSLVTFISGTVAANLNISIVYYRTPPNLRSTYGAISTGAPIISTQDRPTSFTSSGGPNPLDAGNPLPFSRVGGQQTIVVEYVGLTFLNPSKYFSFEVDYGIIGQGAGYIGYISPTANALVQYPSNCTATPINTSYAGAIAHNVQYQVSPSFDSRVYIFTFYTSGYLQQLPTIQLSSGGALGAINIIVHNHERTFYTV